MRIAFSDSNCPKVASKYLKRLSQKFNLSTIQEVIAKATGYRDWHDLQAHLTKTETTETSDQAISEIISSIADRLEILDGDVQYALTKARMFDRLQHIDTQLRMRAMLIRRRNLGKSVSGKIGSIVRFKTDYMGDVPAYIIPDAERSSSRTHVMFDWGTTKVTASEIFMPTSEIADFIPARYWLPYGYWTLQDGSKVVYSCNYLPLWRISRVGVERIEPWYWIKGEKRNFNFGESLSTIYWHRSAREGALAFLREHRVVGLPRLVDAMPFAFDPGGASTEEDIQLLRKKWGTSEELPSYAQERWLQEA